MNKYNFIIVMITLFITRNFAQLECCGNESTLFQFSIVDSLYAGRYDGKYKLNKLINYGDFGLGTFDKLDGEMTILNNSIYQFRADGLLYRANTDNTTPFACIVKFESEESYDIIEKKENEIIKFVDSIIVNKDLFYALKIHGKFSYVKSRTINIQEKPYKNLNEVLKNQIVFERTNLSGTLVGFYSPSFSEKISVPGYHFHFISDELDFGGHVLNFKIDYGKLEIQRINQLKLFFSD